MQGILQCLLLVDYHCCWQLVNCAQNEMNGMQVCVPHSNAQPTAACNARCHLPGQPQAGGDEAFHTTVTLVEGDIGISPLLQLRGDKKKFRHQGKM